MNTDLTVFADFEQIRTPVDTLQKLCKQAGVPEDILGQVELAMQELLTNQVEHAYENNSKGIIEIHFEVDKANIMIQSEDGGLEATFDLGSVKMPDPSSLAEGGYGMAIIKGLMDEVSYHRLNGKNIWKLKKHYVNSGSRTG